MSHDHHVRIDLSRKSQIQGKTIIRNRPELILGPPLRGVRHPRVCRRCRRWGSDKSAEWGRTATGYERSRSGCYVLGV